MSRFILRLRVPLGFLFAAWYLVVARPASWLHLLACAIPVFFGCALRFWAAGYLFKGKRVAVGGPYAYVRNPLYLGSFILGLGFCAVLWRLPPPASALVIGTAYLFAYGLIYPVKIRSEEGELKSALGTDYERYAARVPRFVPRAHAVKGLGEQHFSAELYRRNREYQCILGCAAVLAYLAVRYAFAF
jgi:protein-S-isoprenylcysteine O-methyltransferase Ste14